MITREELLSIPRLHQGMVEDVQRLRWLEEKATCIPSSGRGNPDKVQTSHSNRAGRYVDEAVDLRAELEARHEDLVALKGRAEAWIKTLDSDRARRVMRMRYVQCYSFKHIADKENLTLRRVYQIDKEQQTNL